MFTKLLSFASLRRKQQQEECPVDLVCTDKDNGYVNIRLMREQSMLREPEIEVDVSMYEMARWLNANNNNNKSKKKNSVTLVEPTRRRKTALGPKRQESVVLEDADSFLQNSADWDKYDEKYQRTLKGVSRRKFRRKHAGHRRLA